MQAVYKIFFILRENAVDFRRGRSSLNVFQPDLMWDIVLAFVSPPVLSMSPRLQNWSVLIICNRWIQASSPFEIEHSLITSAQSTKLIIHTVSTTISKDKLNPTPLQQMPPGCVQEVNVGPWWTSLITILVFAKFTLNPLIFMQSFHAAHLTPTCSKLPAIITKSSTYNIS